MPTKAFVHGETFIGKVGKQILGTRQECIQE